MVTLVIFGAALPFCDQDAVDIKRVFRSAVVRPS
jgi:hypothetical protein